MTRHEANNWAYSIYKLGLEIFNPIGNTAFDYTIESQSDTEHDIVFSFGAISTGYPIELPSLLHKNKVVPGFRVWTGRMVSGGHMEPDYMDDVTYCEVQSQAMAIQGVLELYLAHQLDRIAYREFGDEMRELAGKEVK